MSTHLQDFLAFLIVLMLWQAVQHLFLTARLRWAYELLAKQSDVVLRRLGVFWLVVAAVIAVVIFS